MKKYVKPTVAIEKIQAICSMCAGSPVVKTDSQGNTIVNTTVVKDGGDAQEAMSKGYITHYDVWEDKWPDEL